MISRFGGKAVVPLGQRESTLCLRSATAPLISCRGESNALCACMFKVGEIRQSVRSGGGGSWKPSLRRRADEQANKPQQTKVFCGIDVSAATLDVLDVAVIEPDRPVGQRQFPNRASGHKALIGWLGKCPARVRVSLEATGIYSLDLALALDAAPDIELAMLNPKKVSRFAQTLRRSKSDAADAMVLAEFSQRMPFRTWTRSSLSGVDSSHRE